MAWDIEVVSGRTVFLDASVLYPAPLRDLLMYAALAGLFRPKWSEEIHVEWINAVLRQRPDLQRSQLERTRDLMNRSVPDAATEDYASEAIAVGNLPDPGDVHVVAGAIKAKADVILTSNLKDFPDSRLAEHGLDAIHPDAFFCELLKANVDRLIGAVREHRQNLKNPPKTAIEYLGTLNEQRLSGFAKAVAALGIEI